VVYVINPPQDTKDDALANMSHHLGRLDAILAGLADGDLTKIRQIAADNGMSYRNTAPVIAPSSFNKAEGR
jgi:hypothetical protein